MIKPKSLSTWQLIRKSLEQSLPVMLLYVLESHGSSPGRQGFLMAVNAAGEMEGSVGGGIMEHKFVELVKEKLQEEDFTWSIRRQYHDKRAVRDQSGMICSGDQTILLYRVLPTDLPAIKQLIASLDSYQQGGLSLAPEGIRFSANRQPDGTVGFSWSTEQTWHYQEQIGSKNRLYIVGGGHCALALSQLMSRMDFHISLFDNRPDLHTMLLNEAVHQKTVVETYAELAHQIPSGENHYVVIMTFGYRTDDQAIRALLDKDFRYIGVLGSKTKIEKLFGDYRAEGVSAQRLGRFHAPIGLPIHSQTPEEIAVSIAAEIIQVKNAPQ